MKSIPKTLVTWFLGLFNVGVYNLSDGVDSLIMKLKLAGLKTHADTITSLSKTIEYQQNIIIFLDGLKCLFMIMSLGVLIVTNEEEIKRTYQYFKTLFFRLLSFSWRPLKKLFIFLQKTFKPRN